MKLFIKNMVCNRCIYVVENQLKKLKLKYIFVQLGEIDFGNYILTDIEMEKLSIDLSSLGFEILDDKTSQLVEKVKRLILEYVNHLSLKNKKENLSDYLKNNLNYDYNYISNLFSSISGETMEHYYINLKIEKIKELLLYDELTVNEISHQMGYSSASHLSNQFKRETGLTPTYFRKMKDTKIRNPIDNL